MYTDSFLFKYAPNPISQPLWSNPDHGREVEISLRFTLSKLWSSVSLLGVDKAILDETIESVRIMGETASISVRNPSSSQIVYKILLETAEVIGKNSNDHQRHRPDWEEYIREQSLLNSIKSLKHSLKWTNGEEFDHGIAKGWLSKTRRGGAEQQAKITVAERYILASVTENSVSGLQMTYRQMAQQLAGIPTDPRMVHSPCIHLFLPEQHHVESVHFGTSLGVAYHSAVASIQTPFHEYFVLRDNGLEIGCGEVSTLWMKILGCMADGVAC